MLTLGLTLIDGFVLLGITVVLPLALGGRWWWWAGAVLSAWAAFSQPPGTVAALLAVPVVVACGAAALGRLRCFDGLGLLAGVYALVAAGSLVVSRLGAEPFGIGEPIVELTAVHYLYAGTGALTLAARARVRHLSGAAHRIAGGAVFLTAAAPPVVAAGFVLGEPLPQVGGAVLMTIGVYLTGILHLAAAADRGERAVARGLLGVSGFAIWAPMVLAVAWAAGQHWSIPALSIDEMARTHGAANAFAFVIAGLAGRRLSRGRPPGPSPGAGLAAGVRGCP